MKYLCSTSLVDVLLLLHLPLYSNFISSLSYAFRRIQMIFQQKY